MQNFQRKYLMPSSLSLGFISKIQFIKGNLGVDLKRRFCEEDFWNVTEDHPPKDGAVRVPNLSIQSKYVWCWVGDGKLFNFSEPDFVSCSWETSALMFVTQNWDAKVAFDRKERVEDCSWEVPAIPLQKGKGCTTGFCGWDVDLTERVRWESLTFADLPGKAERRNPPATCLFRDRW